MVQKQGMELGQECTIFKKCESPNLGGSAIVFQAEVGIHSLCEYKNDGV